VRLAASERKEVMRRTVLTILVLVFAGLIMWALVQSQNDRPTDRTAEDTEPAETVRQEESAGQQEPAEQSTDQGTEAPAVPAAPAEAEAETGPSVPVNPEPIEGLRAETVEEAQPEPELGSAEKDSPTLSQIRITPYGAGLKRVALSRYSASLQEHVPYLVQQRLPYQRVRMGEDGEPVYNYRYPMAAYDVTVNGGDPVYLLNKRWRMVEADERSATFELRLVDGEGEPVLRIRRTWLAAFS